MIPVIQDQIQGQYSGQPGAATLEEQLELTGEKINQAISEGTYSGSTTNTQQSQSHSDLSNISSQQQTAQEWKTFICPLCGLSLNYPPTVPGIAQPAEDRFKKEHSVYFYFDNMTGFKIKYIVGTPNENVTYEDVKKLRDWWLAGDRFHTYFIVDDINMTKWEINGEKTGSFILGREDLFMPTNVQGMEILLTYHNNHQYSIEFIANATIFDTPHFQNTEKRMIESIRWLK